MDARSWPSECTPRAYSIATLLIVAEAHLMHSVLSVFSPAAMPLW